MMPALGRLAAAHVTVEPSEETCTWKAACLVAVLRHHRPTRIIQQLAVPPVAPDRAAPAEAEAAVLRVVLVGLHVLDRWRDARHLSVTCYLFRKHLSRAIVLNGDNRDRISHSLRKLMFDIPDGVT